MEFGLNLILPQVTFQEAVVIGIRFEADEIRLRKIALGMNGKSSDVCSAIDNLLRPKVGYGIVIGTNQPAQNVVISFIAAPDRDRGRLTVTEEAQFKGIFDLVAIYSA